MSEELEQHIREGDLEAGWQRFAAMRWKGRPPTPAERLQAREAFACGLSWMFEVLMNLGEQPHEFSNRVRDTRDRLRIFATMSRPDKLI